jgi:hypothetical protein
MRDSAHWLWNYIHLATGLMPSSPAAEQGFVKSGQARVKVGRVDCQPNKGKENPCVRSEQSADGGALP